MLLKDLRKETILQGYFKSKYEAVQSWAHLPGAWEILYLEERNPSGHRYELEYSKLDVLGNLYSKYIICYSKKEALYLENKIKEASQQYNTQIKKIY